MAGAVGTLTAGLIGVELLRRRGARILRALDPLIAKQHIFAIGYFAVTLNPAFWLDAHEWWAPWWITVP